MVRDAVIVLEKEGKKRSVYIKIKRIPELLFPLMHKLRVKSAIYDCNVYSYNPEMNFTNAINAGWKITLDERTSYVHEVTIVKTYVSSKKKNDRVCPLCLNKLNKKNTVLDI